MRSRPQSSRPAPSTRRDSESPRGARPGLPARSRAPSAAVGGRCWRTLSSPASSRPISDGRWGRSSQALDGDRRARAPAARRHRLRQDRGLHRRRGGGARAGKGLDRAGAGDRAHAADRGALRDAASATASPCSIRASRAESAGTSGSALRSGEARICVGPRSAIFAPVADLGLVVIDEEHDASYKQEGDPRYDAREVARHRAAESGAALVAGSATPRPESWLALPRLELPTRADGRPLPPVELVDLRERSPRAGPLHPRTVEALAEVADRRAKAIVLLNRRGWSPFLSCRSCGRAWSCPQCDVSLVIHRESDGDAEESAGWALRCHHCGHAEPCPGVLPRLRVGRSGATRRRHGAPGDPAQRGRGAPSGLSPRLRQRGGRRWPSPDPATVRRGGVGRPGGHADGRRRGTTSRTWC